MRRYERIRQLVESSGSRFMSITFIKKNGECRVMQIQPAAGKFRVKGADASPSAQQAAKTRAERYPNLLNVWDVGKGAFRSVNMDTVTEVHCNGETFCFAENP